MDRNDDHPIFFFSPNEAYGEFCPWYPSSFTVKKEDISRLVGHSTGSEDPEGEDHIFFNCSEQFMMYCKADCFHDTQTERRILASHDPKEHKALGRQVHGFDVASWDEIKSEVVVTGNVAKFNENPRLKSILLATGDRQLVEAAPEDRIWGIGYTAAEASQHENQVLWGENRLGKALMEVRDRLRRT